MHMIQKVLKVGTSAAVTISKHSLEKLGLKIGDSVNVDMSSLGDGLLIKPRVALAHPDKELLDWTDRFIEQYRGALEALAKQ